MKSFDGKMVADIFQEKKEHFHVVMTAIKLKLASVSNRQVNEFFILVFQFQGSANMEPYKYFVEFQINNLNQSRFHYMATISPILNTVNKKSGPKHYDVRCWLCDLKKK